MLQHIAAVRLHFEPGVLYRLVRGKSQGGRQHPLVQHPDFEWWLRGVKYEFETRESKGEHVIVTFCRQGIHRSVGTARVIAEILQMQGFDVVQPYSLTPYREFGAKFCSVACTECSRFYPGKLDSFMAASHIWQSI